VKSAVIDGDGRDAFGRALADAAREADPGVHPDGLDRLHAKAFAAPAMIAVVARVRPEAKIPEWEQVASAACVGYAIALAAHQVGLGAIWKSSPFVDGEALRRVLDMGRADRFLGWVNLGQMPEGSADGVRPSVDLGEIVRRVDADGRPVAYAS
jgi:nitroreductase